MNCYGNHIHERKANCNLKKYIYFNHILTLNNLTDTSVMSLKRSVNWGRVKVFRGGGTDHTKLYTLFETCREVKNHTLSIGTSPYRPYKGAPLVGLGHITPIRLFI